MQEDVEGCLPPVVWRRTVEVASGRADAVRFPIGIVIEAEESKRKGLN